MEGDTEKGEQRKRKEKREKKENRREEDRGGSSWDRETKLFVGIQLDPFKCPSRIEKE